MGRIVTGLVAVACAALGQVVAAAPAGADATYHTARIPLSPVGGATGSGTVVNIHANGPNVFAHELYLLKHVVAGSYTVTLHLFPTSQDCSGPGATLTGATLTTNDAGNGVGSHVFTPADATGLRGLTFSVFWTADGPAGYRTACSVITLD
jgi:hypothetical protein